MSFSVVGLVTDMRDCVFHMYLIVWFIALLLSLSLSLSLSLCPSFSHTHTHTYFLSLSLSLSLFLSPSLPLFLTHYLIIYPLLLSLSLAHSFLARLFSPSPSHARVTRTQSSHSARSRESSPLTQTPLAALHRLVLL